MNERCILYQLQRLCSFCGRQTERRDIGAKHTTPNLKVLFKFSKGIWLVLLKKNEKKNVNSSVNFFDTIISKAPEPHAVNLSFQK